MSKFKNFTKAFKKSLYKAGDRLELYGNVYTVTSCDKKYTLMVDSKGTPCAYPTDSIKKMLIKKSFSEHEEGDLQKTDSNFHAGKIRVDKVDSKGRKYHYWVDATHGTKHDSHDSSPSKNQVDHTSMKIHSKMNSIINEHAHAHDAPKLKKMLNDFVEAKAAASNLKEAHNHLAREQGGAHYTTIQNVASKQDYAYNKLNELKTALKESKLKKLKQDN